MIRYPKRVAIIMDGNRRWGKTNKLSLDKTYSLGARNLINIVKKSHELSIEQLTAFAFSTENWNREQYEIDTIFRLLEKFIQSEMADMNKNNIKFKLIGDKSVFKDSLAKIIDRAENLTSNNTGLSFNLAFNYGGEMDLIYSFKLLYDKILSKQKSVNQIKLSDIKKNLYSSSVQDIEFLIRTGGEQRISNFMLLQLSYSELYFSDLSWPEFDSFEYEKSLKSFSNRERRFGSNVNQQRKLNKIN